MNILTATNNWNCTLVATAMVVGVSIEDMVKLIGHDGSEIINKKYKGVASRKGFHMQEIIDAVMSLGFSVTPIEAIPVQIVFEDSEIRYEVFSEDIVEKRFKNHLDNNIGIIMGLNPSGLYHAVAWDGEKIYDPTGRIYDLDKCYFDIKIFWAFSRKSKS